MVPNRLGWLYNVDYVTDAAVQVTARYRLVSLVEHLPGITQQRDTSNIETVSGRAFFFWSSSP